MDADPAPADPSPPTARDLLPILPTVGLVAWFVRLFEADPWVSTGTWVGIAVASAGLIGLPALFWALDHGRRQLTTLIPLGVLAGVLPLVIISGSGMTGLAVRGGLDAVSYALERGAPIPGTGVMPWLMFLRTEVLAATVGAASAAVYWLVVPAWKVGRRPS
jgi:hypothetical protein